MATVLHLQASPMGRLSYSLRAAEAFLESYKQAHPGDAVRTLDASTRGRVQEFDGLAITAKYRILHGEKHSREEAEAWKSVETAIEDFKACDKLVISSPMWNFGIPYRLKQYFDVIVQPGCTFSYSPQEGYKGLVTGRPAMLIVARGGAYSAGTGAEQYDMQLPYLKAILSFIGFQKIDSIVVEPTLQGGPDVANDKLAQAVAEAREKAKRF